MLHSFNKLIGLSGKPDLRLHPPVKQVVLSLSLIKVVLRGYGGVTSEENKNLFKDVFSKNDELNARITIASYIEEKGKLVSKNPLIYELVNNFFGIAEIDTNRPWTICEYDGCEYVQYLDYNIVNPEYNFCKFKNI